MLRNRYILKKRNWKAFSLVELLVVIAIIGILAVMVSVSYGGAQKKSRDTLRKADLQKIASALEMRYAETKTYPATDGYVETSGGIGTRTLLSNLASTGSNKYIDILPCDPTVSKSNKCDSGWSDQDGKRFGYGYYYNLGTNRFILLARLEAPTTEDSNTISSTTLDQQKLVDCGLKNPDGSVRNDQVAIKWNYAIGN